MIKKLMVLVLITSMGSASCATAQNNMALMLDDEALNLIKQEVELRLEQEAKTNKKIELAMQSEAAKRQLIAYFITGVLVAGGIAAIVWYFYNKNANEAAAAAKIKADAELKAATDAAKIATAASNASAQQEEAATNTAAAANAGKTAQQGEKVTGVASSPNAALVEAVGKTHAAAITAAIDARCKVLIAEGFGTAAKHVGEQSAATPSADPVLSQCVLEAKLAEILKAVTEKPVVPIAPISAPVTPDSSIAPKATDAASAPQPPVASKGTPTVTPPAEPRRVIHLRSKGFIKNSMDKRK